MFSWFKVDPNKEILLDVSSTSSDSETEYLTPLTELRKKELLEKERELLQRSKQTRNEQKKKKDDKKKKKDRKTKKSKRKRDERWVCLYKIGWSLMQNVTELKWKLA